MKTLFTVDALPRSGSHAFSQWLLYQFDGAKYRELQNDPVPQVRSNDNLAIINAEIGRDQALQDKRDFERAAWRNENRDIEEIEAEEIPFEFESLHRFILIRSFPNWLVSRSTGMGHKVNQEQVDRYKSYCHAALNKNKLPGHYFIKYDKWEEEESYRWAICLATAQCFTDATKNIPYTLGGKYFEPEGRNQRWKKLFEGRYKGQRRWIDGEIIELHERMFGRFPEELKP